MRAFATMFGGIAMAAIATLVGETSALAATFVYVSNAEDGDISVYRMLDSGDLQAGARVKAASMVMPMAVSPDRRFLYAASRSKPYQVHVYAIDRGTGELKQLSSAPLADSFPYISLDRTGRFLLGASYGGNVVSVNAVESDGRVAVEPMQVIGVGRNAHSIRVDASNRFAYVPTLGSDQNFMFTFDATTGKLSSNTPAVYLAKPVTGPRHFITSGDNRFLYLLSEMAGTVTTLAIDGKSGLLTEVNTISALPGAFRSWLRTITVNRLRTLWRTRRGRAVAAGGSDIGQMLDQLADPNSDLSRRWDQQHDQHVGCRRCERQAHIPVQHGDRASAARLQHRSERSLHGGRGRKIRHNFSLRNRPVEWRAQIDQQIRNG